MTPEEMVKLAEEYFIESENANETNGKYSASIVIARSNKACYWMLQALYAKMCEMEFLKE